MYSIDGSYLGLSNWYVHYTLLGYVFFSMEARIFIVGYKFDKTGMNMYIYTQAAKIIPIEVNSCGRMY